jgi:hypothetical protein
LAHRLRIFQRARRRRAASRLVRERGGNRTGRISRPFRRGGWAHRLRIFQRARRGHAASRLVRERGGRIRRPCGGGCHRRIFGALRTEFIRIRLLAVDPGSRNRRPGLDVPQGDRRRELHRKP